MTLTDERKAKNAMKWIDALPKYKKTVNRLRRGDKPSNYTYCCLGVGAKVCKTDDDLEFDAVANGLVDKVGILDEEGVFTKAIKVGSSVVNRLSSLNDGPYRDDIDFTRVRKFMLRHLSAIFEPGVAKILKAHYKENP